MKSVLRFAYHDGYIIICMTHAIDMAVLQYHVGMATELNFERGGEVAGGGSLSRLWT